MKKQTTLYILGAMILLCGISVIVGWIYDIPSLKSIFPGRGFMMPVTAFSFILTALILLFAPLCLKRNSLPAELIIGISSILIFIIMIYSLSSIIIFKFAGIEALYLQNRSNEIFLNFLPRLPSLGTALAFLVVAFAGKTLLLKPEKLKLRLKTYSLIILAISGVAAIGYITNIPELYYKIPDVCEPMAIHTTLFLIVTAFALFIILYSSSNKEALVTIRKKLLVVILPLLIVAIVFVWVISITISFSYLISGTLKDLKSINSLKSNTISIFFNDLKKNMQIIQKYYNIRRNLPVLSQQNNNTTDTEYSEAVNMLNDQLMEWTKIESSILSFMLADTKGTIVYEIKLNNSTETLLGKNLRSLSERAYIEGNHEISINNIYTPDNILYNEGFIFVAPVYDFDNKFTGEVIVKVDISKLLLSINESSRLEETAETLIVKRLGDSIVYLTSPLKEKNHTGKLEVRLGSSNSLPAQLAATGKSGYGISIDYMEDEVIASWNYIPELDWGIVTKVNVSEILAHYKPLNRLVILLCLLLTAISALIITRISYSLTKSLSHIQKGIKVIRTGNLDYKVFTETNDEIGYLSKAFDEMTDNLKKTTASRDELDSAIRKIKESEEIYKAIGESINYGIWICDSRGKNIYMSQCCLDMTGKTQEEVSGDEWATVLHPDDISNSLKNWKECIENEGLWNVEHRILSKNGDYRYTLSRGVPIKDEKGHIKYWAGINLDITELKKIEHELSIKNKLMLDMMDNSPALIYLFNLEGQLITSNTQFARLFSKERDEIIGKKREEFMPESIALQHFINDRKVIDLKSSIIFEETNIESEDIHFYHSVKFPLIDKDNILYGVAGISSDITERKLIESTLLFLSQGAFRTPDENYYVALVKFIAKTLNMDFAYVGQARKGNPVAKTIAVSLDGRIVENTEFVINQTPCGNAFGQSICCYADSVKSLFPDDRLLFDIDAESYAGTTLWNSSNEPIGIIAVIGRKKLKNQKLVESILQLVAVSAANEIERDMANEKLIESEEKYRSLVEVSQDAILISFRNQIIYINKTALSLFGGTSEEDILEKNPFDFFHPEHRDTLRNQIYSMMKENSNLKLSLEKVIRLDGKVIEVELSASPLIYKNKPAIQMVIRDVTEEREKQKELDESQQQLKAVFDLAKDGIVAVDIETKNIVITNPAFLEKLGLQQSKIPEMSIFDIHPEDQMEFVISEFNLAAKGLSSLAPNMPIKKSDGSIFYADISISQIKIRERLCLLGIFHDITERKQVEEILNRNTQFRQGIIDAISSNICVINESGEIIAVNNAWNEFAKANPPVSSNIGVGANYFEICKLTTGIDNTIATCVLQGLHRLLNFETDLYSCEYPCHSPHKKRWFLLRAACLSTEKNNRNKFIVLVHTDITDLKQLETNLIAAKEKAEAANNAKTKFVSIMTHELRSPLNSILGFTEILNRETYGKLNERQKQFTMDILDSGKHLLSLINDVLDSAKIDAGRMTLTLSDININSLISNSAYMFREVCAERKIKLEINHDKTLPTVKADERKLKQVMYNLLSNAIKFTPDGGKISISALLANDNLIISVKDSGIGIEEKDREKVFTEFEQIDSSQTRKYSGTGIGMPISKKIMMLHGGNIWFESEGEGKGTTFFISIPIGQPNENFIGNNSDITTVEWRNEYKLNIKEIDSQHEKLLDFISVLNEDLDGETKHLVVNNVCKTLIEYTHYHFTTEEKLMRENNYPEIESHINAHKVFVKKVEEFAEKVDTNPDLDKEIVQFVVEWLINHILKVDSKLCEFLNAKGVL